MSHCQHRVAEVLVKGTLATPVHIAWVMMAHIPAVILVWYREATGEAQDMARRIRTLGGGMPSSHTPSGPISSWLSLASFDFD